MKKEKMLLPLDAENALTPWLWIGTWSMGGEGFGSHDERESLKVLRTAVENNIRHFDTAGFYAHGKSEKLLQKIIKTDRQKFFISSKGGLVWKGRKVEHRASPGDLRTQLFESLDRLKTDYLDLYQVHWPDPEIPLHESITALIEFQEEGLVRYWGAGNLTEQQVKDNLKDERNIPHQVHFNPVHQNHGVLQAGKDLCINCIISPLEQGLLGDGKSSSGTSGLGKKDSRNKNPYFSNPEVLKWEGKLNELLKQHSLSKVSLILMWICSQPHVHTIITGPRQMEHLNKLLEFRAEVEKNDLIVPLEKVHTFNNNLQMGLNVSILSAQKVRKIIPEEIWRHLSKGPDK